MFNEDEFSPEFDDAKRIADEMLRNAQAQVGVTGTTSEAFRAVIAEQAIQGRLVALLSRHTRWGWAVIRNRDFYSRVRATAEVAEADVEGGWLKAHPVLVITSIVGRPLVIPLTEEDLADLGTCPNL
jgi:L-lactate utilization protein LutC